MSILAPYLNVSTFSSFLAARAEAAQREESFQDVHSQEHWSAGGRRNYVCDCHIRRPAEHLIMQSALLDATAKSTSRTCPLEEACVCGRTNVNFSVF